MEIIIIVMIIIIIINSNKILLHNCLYIKDLHNLSIYCVQYDGMSRVRYTLINIQAFTTRA